jgi:membrane-associated phospholipid phosphatase
MLVLNGVGYEVTLRIAEWRGVSVWDSECWIDRAIPATPWAMWIYSSLYLYALATILLAPRGDKGVRALCVHLQGQVWLGSISYAIFLLLPTEIHIRAEMEAALTDVDGPLRTAYDILYLADAPYNAWPSLHVSLSLLTLLTALRFARARGEHRSSWIWWGAWVALCWSVVATKQHFFLDVWTGALAALSIWFFYLRTRLNRVLGDWLQKR